MLRQRKNRCYRAAGKPAIRARPELAGNFRDLALFNPALDSKLRGCDLVRLKAIDLVSNEAHHLPSSKCVLSALQCGIAISGIFRMGGLIFEM
jgi:hypothetical protein